MRNQSFSANPILPSLPKVALIGRTNVGKSSLFNRAVEEDKSLVSNLPGTTRDRFEADCVWRGRLFRLVDTGGLDVDARGELEKNVLEQSAIAMREADAIVFVVDVTVGIMDDDLRIARELASSTKPVIVVGNKADTAPMRARVEGNEWTAWPLPRPIAVSAKQGTGVGDLLDVITNALTAAGKEPVEAMRILPRRVAVIGEPNVGKSTLLNALLGEKRFITASVAGTTREPNDAALERDGQTYVFVDTAGIRKSASMRRSGDRLESLGVMRTLDMLRHADVALFVIDVSRGISTQEKHLAGKLAESGVSLVVVANKWDLVEGKTPTTINKVEKYIRAILPQIDYAPIVLTSALNRQRTETLFAKIEEVFAARFVVLSDEETDAFMSKAIQRHKPSRGKGVKHPQILSFTQTSVNPPRFTLAVDLPRKDSLADSYVRFLENLMREAYNFTGTPIFLRVATARKKHTTSTHHR